MPKGKMCVAHKVAMVLVLVGALNWGLVGGFGLNLVNSLLGSWPMAEKVVYVLVGLAAVAMLFTCKCKMCGHGCGGSCGGDGKSCGAEDKGCCGEGEHKM